MEELVTSVKQAMRGGERGNRGRNEERGTERERGRKETSANYNVQQAKLQCRLRLSLGSPEK